MKSFRGGSTCNVNVSDLKTGKIYLIKEIQNSMEGELLNKASSKYKSLMPVQDDQGIQVIGSRFSSHNPMTTHSDQPQILLPSYHPYTRTLMRQAYSQSGHCGCDSTLARFRLNYWVPQDAKTAKGVCSTCQKCKVKDPKLSSQIMGKLPKERLTPDFAFTHTMLGLFWPYDIRGRYSNAPLAKLMVSFLLTQSVERYTLTPVLVMILTTSCKL